MSRRTQPTSLLQFPRHLGRSKMIVEEAKQVFRDQAKAVEALADRLDTSYVEAIELLLTTVGKVVVLGMGKSGHIGRKMAATFASTGTPSFFVQAGEAYHGDLGMIAQGDTVILISQSGETEEVIRLMPHLRRLGVPMIALTGCLFSSLGLGVDVVLDVAVEREVCPNNLAPTSSTLAALAMGDSLAVSLMKRRSFQAAEFGKYHPGGSLGRQLLTVKEAMRVDDLPMVSSDDTVGHSLMTISEGRLGLVLVMNGDKLIGLITDGDLRRAMQQYPDLLTMPVSDIMTTNPVTIPESTRLVDAHHRMQQMKLKAFVVVDREGKVSGVVEVFEE
ncbi:MAG: KpsF/GutQ family sugar-phosphate isomerase [Kofleriaceae bacterium]|nr:KpsF/GutQ family sugar-phosphate isomerase [Kofleriaceae bacterium]